MQLQATHTSSAAMWRGLMCRFPILDFRSLIQEVVHMVTARRAAWERHGRKEGPSDRQGRRRGPVVQSRPKWRRRGLHPGSDLELARRLALLQRLPDVRHEE